jgi:NADH:ubiquinone oxidoreductase subunit 6 (subunit J)
MDTVIFILLAVLLLGSGAAMVWLKSPVYAAYALLATLLAGAGIIAWLHAYFIGLALLLSLVAGAALLLMAALPWLKHSSLGEGRPDEDRSFWAGIVAVLFFVITYRVVATSPWGVEDRSRISIGDSLQGVEALRALGATILAELALPLLLGGVMVGVAFACAFALTGQEPSKGTER